jgi:hypothetical protein
MSADLEVKGLNELLAKLTKLGGVVTSKPVVQAMRENMAHLKEATVALAPIDEGDLVRGTSYRVTTKDGAVIGEVGVNATAEDGYPYPVRQHEDMTLKPGPQTALKPDYDGMTPGTKYLERPFNRYKPNYIDNLAEGVKQAIEELS